MSVWFSRSTRALAADEFHRPLIIILLMAILLMVWGYWFVFARITVYQVTDDAVLVRADARQAISPQGMVVVARFRAEALGHLEAGQPAQLRLDGFPWTQYGAIPATVTRVSGQTADRIRVELTVHPLEHSTIPLQPGLRGAVEVAVEQVSPLTLMVRSVGQRLDTASASVGRSP